MQKLDTAASEHCSGQAEPAQNPVWSGRRDKGVCPQQPVSCVGLPCMKLLCQRQMPGTFADNYFFSLGNGTQSSCTPSRANPCSAVPLGLFVFSRDSVSPESRLTSHHPETSKHLKYLECEELTVTSQRVFLGHSGTSDQNPSLEKNRAHVTKESKGLARLGQGPKATAPFHPETVPRDKNLKGLGVSG